MNKNNIYPEHFYKHECHEWDFMEIDLFSPEFFCCRCFKEVSGYDSRPYQSNGTQLEWKFYKNK